MSPINRFAINCGLRLIGCLIVGALLVGCGGGRGDGKVVLAGTVKHAGKTLSGGSVLFSSEKSDGGTALIEPAGRFSVALLPGDYRIVVRCDDGSATISEAGVYVAGKSLIPERYGDVATSDLTVTVTRGMQPLQLDLPP
jgi:hypothetical protein